MNGHLVGSPVHQWETPTQRTGKYRALWEGTTEKGRRLVRMYYLRLTAGDFTSCKKVVLLK